VLNRFLVDADKKHSVNGAGTAAGLGRKAGEEGSLYQFKDTAQCELNN